MKKDILISLFIFIFCLIAPASLLADDTEDRLNSLMTAKSLKCSFEDGLLYTWKNGELSSQKIAMAPIIFDSINFKTEKARMIARLGSVDVRAIMTLGTAHFTESTESGVWLSCHSDRSIGYQP